MPKGLRILGYILVGFISFIIFLYLTFPFDVLKDRILAGVEKGLKGKYDIQVASVSPRLLAGITLKSVRLNKRDEGGSVPVWEAEKIKLNASLFSMMFGSPRVKFDIRSGGGRISGRVNMEKNGAKVTLRLGNVNLGKIYYLASKYGLNLKSEIDGKVDLDINPSQIIRSSGTLIIEPRSIKLLASKIKAGAMGEIDLPAIAIGEDKSLISAELKRGAIKINSFRLEKGDLNIDLKGTIYLSSEISNFRLNLKGNFGFTEKVGEALPFLFIIEKQKNEDGTFPLTISGRLAKPQIKIGDFTVPL